jgi:hypothetical protein
VHKKDAYTIFINLFNKELIKIYKKLSLHMTSTTLTMDEDYVNRTLCLEKRKMNQEYSIPRDKSVHLV